MFAVADPPKHRPAAPASPSPPAPEDQSERKGAKPGASALAVELATRLKRSEGTFSLRDLRSHTAGNLRSEYRSYIGGGECSAGLKPIFAEVLAMTRARIADASELDLIVVAEGLMLSDTSAETLRQLAPHVVNCHAKFYNMTEIPCRPGCYQDISIDYDAAIAALKAGGYAGYLNTEYEGQRYYQDRTRAEMMSEIEQVRRHQGMLRRLIEA